MMDLEIGKKIKEHCWLCSHSTLEILMGPIDNDNYLSRSPVLICPACGLIQKRSSFSNGDLERMLESSYYNNYDHAQLVKRSEDRSLVDSSRCVEYIDFIMKHIDSKQINRALDIGGAEGLFSHILKKMYPNIEVCCLEPDSTAVSTGKKLYPEVNFLNYRLENLSEITVKEFDIITYWGGFYRTTYPMDTVKSLYSILSNGGVLALSLPHTLEESEAQAYEPMDSLDELLGCFRKGIFLLLNNYYIEAFLKQYFRLIKQDKIQNFPFFKKIPFYLARRIDTPNPNPFKPSPEYHDFYNSNRKYVLEYANTISRQRFRNLVAQNKLEKIGIWGTGTEAEILLDIAKEAGVEVPFMIDPLCLNTDEKCISGTPIRPLSEVYRENIDALIIADYENQTSIFDQLVSRIHLNRKIKIIKGFKEKKYPNKRVCFSLDGNNYLQKAFSFIILNEE